MGYSIISLIVGCNSKTQSNTKSTSFGFGNTSYSFMNPNQSAQTAPQGQQCFLGVFNGSEGIYANSAGTEYYTNEAVPNGFCPVLTFNTPQSAIPNNYNYSTQSSSAVPTCLFDANQKVVYYSTGTQPTYKSPLRSPSQYSQVCPSDFIQLVGSPVSATTNYQGTSDMKPANVFGQYEGSTIGFQGDKGISVENDIVNTGDVVYNGRDVNAITNQCMGAVDPKVQEGKPMTYNGNGKSSLKVFIYDDAINVQTIIDYSSKRLYFNVARSNNGQINQCSVPITSIDGMSKPTQPGTGCNPERFVRAHASRAYEYMNKTVFDGCVIHHSLECTFGTSSNALTLLHTYLPGKYNAQNSLLDTSGDSIQFRTDPSRDNGITTVDANDKIAGNEGQCNKVAAMNSIINLGTVYFYKDLY